MTSPGSIDFRRKADLFRRLDALDNDDDIDDKVWEQEIKRKENCRAFFTSQIGFMGTAPPAAPTAPGRLTVDTPVVATPAPVLAPAPVLTTNQKNINSASSPTTIWGHIIDLTSDEVEPVIIPRTLSPRPRRNRSAPGVIENTPSPLNNTAKRRLDLLRAASERAAAASVTVIEETPIPDTAKLTRQAASISASFATSGDESPSTTAANMPRKRKRGEPQLVPEAERIFKDFNFFYVPNNDIHPARKIRIAKAREYGANWVRSIEGATHVIVDKNLQYKDILSMLRQDDSGSSDYVVVTEDYPVDCIRYKTALNPRQKLYEVRGAPEQPPPPPTEEEEPQAQQAASRDSLSLKPPPRNLRSRVRDEPSQVTPPHSQDFHETPPSTPSLQRHATVPSRPGEQPMSSPIQSPKRAANPTKQPEYRDELSKYIDMMEQYKNLPLDKDSDGEDSISDIQEPDSEDGISEGERGHKRQKAAKGKEVKLLSKNKNISWQDRFACNHGGTKESKAEATNSPNRRTIEVLQGMLDYYERTNDTWRILAYRKAIGTLRRQKTQVRTAEEAYQLPNIGARLADKIEEIAATDRLRKLDSVQAEPRDSSLQLFLGVYGVGTSIARGWVAQGFSTLGELLADPTRAKLTMNQRVGVERYSDLNTRIPRREVRALSEHVKGVGREIDPAVEMIVGGSYRRGAESSGDVDFIITKKGTKSSAEMIPFLEVLLERLEEEGTVVCTLAALHADRKDGAGSKWHGCCVLPEKVARQMVPMPKESEVPLPLPPPGGQGKQEGKYNPIWRRVDFLLVPETEYGAALLYFTGNDIFNRSMRLLASKKGMRLNQRGLYAEALKGPARTKVTEGRLVEGRDERRIFEALGVKWRKPEERWC